LKTNHNQVAGLYINKTNEKANYLKLKLKFEDRNSFAIGAKAFSYHNGNLQFKELYTVRGFQASSEPILHFGYGSTEKIDSLKIVWPDNTSQILKDVAVNQTLTISKNNAKPFDYNTLKSKSRKLFQRVENNLGIDFVHREDNYVDFNRQKLIPYQIGDRGPAVDVGDLDNDGKKDIFFGGSRSFASQIYLQKDTIFAAQKMYSITKDSIKEIVATVISDFNGDGKNDLVLGSGGADFFNTMKPLLNSYYVQKDSVFETKNFPESFENTSILSANDFDGDGDFDLFVGNQSISNDFGNIPSSYLLENDNGNFLVHKNNSLQNVGMITDAIWHDFDEDGVQDLITIGEWMAPTFFKNENGKLVKKEVYTNKLNGLWQRIVPFDIDGDGDTDYVLGNWGTNSKFVASEKSPMKMYHGDFDKNGQTETVTAIVKNGNYYPLENLDQLAAQLVFLKKKFTTYHDFAGKTVAEIFEKETLQKAKVLEVSELRSGFLRNEDGKYTFVPFEDKLQVSPIMALLTHDFDQDGKEEVLAAGNYFGVKPFQGRFDSFPGAIIKDENNVILTSNIGLNLPFLLHVRKKWSPSWFHQKIYTLQ